MAPLLVCAQAHLVLLYYAAASALEARFYQRGILIHVDFRISKSVKIERPVEPGSIMFKLCPVIQLNEPFKMRSVIDYI